MDSGRKQVARIFMILIHTHITTIRKTRNKNRHLYADQAIGYLVLYWAGSVRSSFSAKTVLGGLIRKNLHTMTRRLYVKYSICCPIGQGGKQYRGGPVQRKHRISMGSLILDCGVYLYPQTVPARSPTLWRISMSGFSGINWMGN